MNISVLPRGSLGGAAGDGAWGRGEEINQVILEIPAQATSRSLRLAGWVRGGAEGEARIAVLPSASVMLPFN